MAIPTITQNCTNSNTTRPVFNWSAPDIINTASIELSKEYGKESALQYIDYASDNTLLRGQILPSINVQMHSCCNLIAQQAFFEVVEQFLLQDAVKQQAEDDQIIQAHYAALEAVGGEA